MAVALMDKAAGQVKLPETPAVVALFAFGSRLDRDTMQLFARTHSEEVRAAAIASTGQEVLELLHGGLRPQVLVLDALLTKPAVTQVLQEIGKMDLKPEPAVLVLVPVPEETAARRALGLFSRYEIMLRPYGMKNLFDEIYRVGTDVLMRTISSNTISAPRKPVNPSPVQPRSMFSVGIRYRRSGCSTWDSKNCRPNRSATPTPTRSPSSKATTWPVPRTRVTAC